MLGECRPKSLKHSVKHALFMWSLFTIGEKILMISFVVFLPLSRSVPYNVFFCLFYFIYLFEKFKQNRLDNGNSGLQSTEVLIYGN